MVLVHTGTLFSRESIQIIFAAQEKNGKFLAVILKNTDRTFGIFKSLNGILPQCVY